MNIRIGPVMITQCFPRFPVPVGAGTIAPAIPDTQYKPGKSSKQYSCQVQLSCFGKSPAHHIEQCKCRMKNKEEDIEELVPHNVKVNKDCLCSNSINHTGCIILSPRSLHALQSFFFIEQTVCNDPELRIMDQLLKRRR